MEISVIQVPEIRTLSKQGHRKVKAHGPLMDKTSPTAMCIWLICNTGMHYYMPIT